jgi:acyl carrier protein
MTERFKNIVEKWYDKIYLYKLSDDQKSKYITDDTTLYMLDVDSLDETELILDLETSYKIVITDMEKWDKGFKYMKFGDMCEWIESKHKEKSLKNNV